MDRGEAIFLVDSIPRMGCKVSFPTETPTIISARPVRLNYDMGEATTLPGCLVKISVCRQTLAAEQQGSAGNFTNN